MTSPLEEIADVLNFRNLSFVPILPGEKRPGEFNNGFWLGFTGWTKHVTNFPTQEEIKIWKTWPGAGIGLVTGELSKIVALDFDYELQLLEGHISDLDLSCSKFGAKGFTAFFRYDGELNRKWLSHGETVLELLSDGRQTVLPPSLHPSGATYTWRTSKTLLSTQNSDLPILPIDFQKRMDQLFKKVSQETQLVLGVDLNEVREALKFIPADSYDLWIKIGMALRSALGPQGFVIWDEWSQKSLKYIAAEMGRKWSSFSGASRLNIASVFFEANQYGFKPLEKIKPIPREQEIRQLNPQNSIIKKSDDYKKLTPELISNAPGLVGEIANWINKNSIYPQPELALAASLAAVGALKGHRVRGETNLRTNILTVGIAPSGAGKSRAMDLIEELFIAADLDFLFGGRPKSDAGLLKMLIEGKGRKLINWDEIGLSLSEMTSKNAQTHKSGILSRVMDLFSKSGGMYRGDQYANHDNKQARQDIDQPCLCVYGASTPSRFFEALSSSHAVDGFAARWLIFESLNAFPDRCEIGEVEIPQILISKLKNHQLMTKNLKDQGNIAKKVKISPPVIKFSSSGKACLKIFWNEFDKRRKESKTEVAQTVWARAAEHLQKVCLICATGYEPIGESLTNWCNDIICCTSEYIIFCAESRVADNQNQKNSNKIYEIIKLNQEITLNELHQKSRWLTKRERNDIISDLEIANMIQVENQKTSSKKITVLRVLK